MMKSSNDEPNIRNDRLKYIKKLLDECAKQGPDVYGYIRYIPKEIIDDATKEYQQLTRHHAKRSK